MSIDLNKPYNPGIAEIGRFTEVVAPSVSSYGHYAVLTVNAGTLPVSAGGLGGPLGTQEDPIWTNMTTVISAVEVSLSGVQMDENIKEICPIAISSVDIPPEQAVPTYIVGTNNVTVSVLSFDSSLSAVTFPETISFFELFNNDTTDKVYVTFDTNVTTIATLTAQGLPILGQSYYSIEKSADTVIVGAISATDIRVFGHNRQ